MAEFPSDEEVEVAEESDVPDLEDEEYEVDYIVDSRIRQYGNKSVLEYFIHWKGYPKEERTWTLADQFDEDDPPVLAFHRNHPNKARKNQKTVHDMLMSGAAKQAVASSKLQLSSRSKPNKVAKAAPGKENRQTKRPKVVARSDSGNFIVPGEEDGANDSSADYQEWESSKSDSFIDEDEDDEPGGLLPARTY